MYIDDRDSPANITIQQMLGSSAFVNNINEIRRGHAEPAVTTRLMGSLQRRTFNWREARCGIRTGGVQLGKRRAPLVFQNLTIASAGCGPPPTAAHAGSRGELHSVTLTDGTAPPSSTSLEEGIVPWKEAPPRKPRHPGGVGADPVDKRLFCERHGVSQVSWGKALSDHDGDGS